MLRLIAVLLTIWVSSSVALVFIQLDKIDNFNDRLCVLDRALVSILDPGYKKLTITQRRAIAVDISAIVSQEPCTITYPPLPRGS